MRSLKRLEGPYAYFILTISVLAKPLLADFCMLSLNLSQSSFAVLRITYLETLKLLRVLELGWLIYSKKAWRFESFSGSNKEAMFSNQSQLFRVLLPKASKASLYMLSSKPFPVEEAASSGDCLKSFIEQENLSMLPEKLILDVSRWAFCGVLGFKCLFKTSHILQKTRIVAVIICAIIRSCVQNIVKMWFFHN